MAGAAELHEKFHDEDAGKIGSDRSFGVVFTIFFAVLGLWPLRPWADATGEPRWAFLAGSAVFLLVALVVPKILHPLNVVWMKFAALLNRIVSPIVMGVMFFVVVTPFALLVRATGKDLLRLKRDPQAKSYWIRRDPPGPPPDTMINQF